MALRYGSTAAHPLDQLPPKWHKGLGRLEKRQPIRKRSHDALAGFCARLLRRCSPLAAAPALSRLQPGSAADDASNDATKDAAYQERPIDQIYADAWKQVRERQLGRRRPSSSTKWSASIPIRSGRAAPC